jgi:hypothetical protein
MLSEIDNKIVIKGTYEDESYDPSGAFIYAGTSYSNMEDLDEIYNQEKAFEDDFYNEKWQDKLFKLEQELVEIYLKSIKDVQKNIDKSIKLEDLEKKSVPVVVYINHKNVEKYYNTFTNLLNENKFNFIVLDKSKYWSSYVFDSTKAIINLKSLKKIIKKCIPSAEFYEDFFELDKIKNSTLKVNPSDENAALFNCLQITIPFEKL